MNERERHNRSVMLQRIKTYWLVGVLQESLHGAEIIDLAMAYRPSAVQNGESVAAFGFAYGESFDQPLPVGSSIVDVYDQAGGTLLIMGEPGAGKTTTLLQLVSGLLERAELDDSRPIPVVFGLASWQLGQPLGSWMVNELSNNYEVPRRLGEAWLKSGLLLPLLDGLDEVDIARREACAQAINSFRQRWPHLATAVTCRIQDYEQLDTDLMLSQAIVLQPLSLAQIDQYLAGVGKRLAGLRAALQTDDTLRELAQSPLMLSIMTLAYYRVPEDAAISLGDRGMARKLLFEVYVDRMSRYRDGEKLYAPVDTVRWLSWLARQMYAHNQTLFFLEGIQPSWLVREQRRPYLMQLRLTVGVVVAVAGIVAGVLGLFVGNSAAGWLGLLFGAVAGVVTAVLSILPPVERIVWQRIDTTESLSLSWAWALLGGALGTLTGLLLGGGMNWAARRLGIGADVPWLLLFPVLVAGLLITDRALQPNEMKIRTQPGEGIYHSRLNAWRVGGAVGGGTAVLLGIAFAVGMLLKFPLMWGQLLPYWVGTAVYLGVISGLRYGGMAVWQHRLLVKRLRQSGEMPTGTAVQFMDYAAERRLLRKVGGGYMFVHALLLDYFRHL